MGTNKLYQSYFLQVPGNWVQSLVKIRYWQPWPIIDGLDLEALRQSKDK